MSDFDPNADCFNMINPADVPINACNVARMIGTDQSEYTLRIQIDTTTTGGTVPQTESTVDYNVFKDGNYLSTIKSNDNLSFPFVDIKDVNDACSQVYGSEWGINQSVIDTYTGVNVFSIVATDITQSSPNPGVEQTDAILVCQHLHNYGTPENCCFQDANNFPSDQNKTDPTVVTNGLIATCPLATRNLGSDLPDNTVNDGVPSSPSNPGSFNVSCRDVVKDHCTPTTVAGVEQWFSSGDTHSCSAAFKRIASAVPEEGYGNFTVDANGTQVYPLIFGIQGSNSPISQIIQNWRDVNKYPDTHFSRLEPFPQVVSPEFISADTTIQKFSKDQVGNLFNVLHNNGVNVTAEITDPGFNPVSQDLYQLCLDYPFACKDSLLDLCKGFDTNDLQNLPEASKWCGCYLPDSEYKIYSDNFGIPRQCSSQCNRDGVIPLVNFPNIQPENCTNENICIIDNNSINFALANSSGTVSLSQICSGCASNNGECECIIDSNKIDLLGQNSNLTIDNFCRQETFFTTDAEGNVIKTNDPNETRKEEDAVITDMMFRLLFVSVVIIIGLLVYFFLA